MTDAELDGLVERLERGGFHPYEGRHIPDDLTDEAAATITALRARIATLEADRAEWVEVERLRMGKV